MEVRIPRKRMDYEAGQLELKGKPVHLRMFSYLDRDTPLTLSATWVGVGVACMVMGIIDAELRTTKWNVGARVLNVDT